MGMMVERLKHEGTSHSSSDVEDLWDQLVSTGFQTDLCNTIWAWCFLSLLLPEDLAHIVFADLNCRCGERGVAGGVNGCV